MSAASEPPAAGTALAAPRQQDGPRQQDRPGRGDRPGREDRQDRVRRVGRRAGVDAGVLAVMLTTLAVRRGDLESPGADLLALTVLAWLPLLLRARQPLLALVGATGAECLHLVVLQVAPSDLQPPTTMGVYQPVPLATMVAVAALASRRPPRTAWAAGGAAAALLLAVSLLAQPLELWGTAVVVVDVVVLSTGAGALVRARRERQERDVRARQEETRQAVVAERLRIARDLHDVLAHHMTVVNAQAGVAEYLLRSDPSAAATALGGITANTRRALAELRATIGLLRDDDGSDVPEDGAGGTLQPVPGVARIGDLVAGFAAAGAAVTCAEIGKAGVLASDADLAAYRIVQEALTNATKHAPGAPVEVSLAWFAERLELGVSNGPAPARRGRAAPGPGTGHGLLGMRERVAACGGTVEAGPRAGGGFAVRAVLPVAGDGGVVA